MEIQREIKTVEQEVFTFNGETFYKEEDAIEYKNKVEESLSRSYYIVATRPDLTEGRGYYSKIIISTPGRISSVYQYLQDMYGSAIALVQDSVAIDNYVVSRRYEFDNYDEIEDFLNEYRTMGIGDYREKSEVEHVRINSKGEDITKDSN